jgi:DNA-binding NtrC family response regulator
MPARVVVVVVHDEASIRDEFVNALHRAGYEVAGFSETRTALAVIETGGHIDLLISRVTFPKGTQHGVSLALMARLKHRNLKVLFVARQEMVEHTQGVGEVLQTPVLADDVVAKVQEMLAG